MEKDFEGRPAEIDLVVMYKASFGADYLALHHDKDITGCLKYIKEHRAHGGGGEYKIVNREGKTI